MNSGTMAIDKLTFCNAAMWDQYSNSTWELLCSSINMYPICTV